MGNQNIVLVRQGACTRLRGGVRCGCWQLYFDNVSCWTRSHACGLGGCKLPTECRETLVEDTFVHVVAYAADEDGFLAFCALFHGRCLPSTVWAKLGRFVSTIGSFFPTRICFITAQCEADTHSCILKSASLGINIPSIAL